MVYFEYFDQKLNYSTTSDYKMQTNKNTQEVIVFLNLACYELLQKIKGDEIKILKQKDIIEAKDGKLKLVLNEKYEILNFYKSILDLNHATEIFQDVANSVGFIEKFKGRIEQARNKKNISEYSEEVYNCIANQDGNEISLKKKFSFSTHLLHKLTFPKEIKFLASKEHYNLLSFYLQAIECSKKLYIEGVLDKFEIIAQLEIPKNKISIGLTDSVLSIYLDNIRCWLTHYACSFYLIEKYNEHESILSLSEIIKFIKNNIKNAKKQKLSLKIDNDQQTSLLTATSLYGSIRIIGNTFSFLRQWTEAFIREEKDQDKIKASEKFTKILNKIQQKANIISNKIPILIEEENKKKYSDYAEGYATFTLHKIAIFLFKIGIQVEKFIKENNEFASKGEYENSLEQMIFSIKIFASFYSYSLGLGNIDCSNDITIVAIYESYKRHFNGVEDFLKEEEGRINFFILNKKNGLDCFIESMLEKIKNKGYFAKHKTRDIDSDDNYYIPYLEYSKKKILSFEECNPEFFDKDTELSNMENNSISITPHKMESSADKFNVLLEEIRDIKKETKEQNNNFNKKFEEQSNEIKGLIIQNNTKFSKLENLLSDTNKKIDKISDYSATKYLKYYQDYDLTNTTITVQEKREFANFLGIEYIESSNFFNPKTKNNMDRVTELLKDLSVNLRDKYYFLIQNFGTIEKGLLFLEYLERDFKKFTNLEQ